MRIDIRLKEEFNISRQKAQELIKNQKVSVNGNIIAKASLNVFENDVVDILENNVLKYVSRGGLKLEYALESFNISVNDLICIDIGASTGGFTNVLLEKGAKKIYAVDVGTQQMAESLKNNSRVALYENTNITQFVKDAPVKADFICVDVSFVSVTKILYCIKALLNENNYCIILVKPQFECGKEFNKKGIVKDPKIHRHILTNVIGAVYEQGLMPLDIVPSPIKGGDGNGEYLLLIKNAEGDKKNFKFIIDRVVEEQFK